ANVPSTDPPTSRTVKPRGPARAARKRTAEPSGNKRMRVAARALGPAGRARAARSAARAAARRALRLEAGRAGTGLIYNRWAPRRAREDATRRGAPAWPVIAVGGGGW